MARVEAFRLLSTAPNALAGFYQNVFGFNRADTDRLFLGPSALEIGRAKLAYPQDITGNDPRFQHCAIVVTDMGKACEALAKHDGWSPITLDGPQRLPAASGGVAAFKFRDPEGHPLEFICFPPDRVPELWKGHEGIFLGIDHSAMAVADTERSLHFYESIGLRIGSRQVNRGAEQGRLDNMAAGTATQVEVIGLEFDGSSGPHLELLAYRDPEMRAEKPVSDESAAATHVVIEGHPGFEGIIFDPDGHRLDFR
ncbi:VOC family protein [Mesorhizobium sp. INR15]|uniref:VOC family protein n=1 Tax=Mesorhizobium sp. INR15 TaxID=2654248 RepID=UPI00189687FD|nr:VOC family protein [Mesorhizobium sp. INR15]QPC95391.1 hypothetical protein GA829_32715 [Mesorhizobium sp. INR15]QPC95984.1 hypothetical protein GA829_36435 [Mesorhizobium sp. INR15]